MSAVCRVLLEISTHLIKDTQKIYVKENMSGLIYKIYSMLLLYK